MGPAGHGPSNAGRYSITIPRAFSLPPNSWLSSDEDPDVFSFHLYRKGPDRQIRRGMSAAADLHAMAIADIELPIMGGAHYRVTGNEQALGEGIVRMGTGVLDGIEFVVDPEQGDGEPVEGNRLGLSGDKIGGLARIDPPFDYLGAFLFRHVIDTKCAMSLQDIFLGVLEGRFLLHRNPINVF